ncbi:myelin basic -like isoform X2 [Labeo rohita]|uniref:Myelin basic-like isoform X2 n=1 Tax=Labeo rohita TaxID=84645 RepID=A0A498NQU8_LABRO|nr:myelin basic -like isoform X2 [Labeo rohita]
MATASTSGQSPFGLGRKKRSPGLLDQIGRFFGGDKKRKGKSISCPKTNYRYKETLPDESTYALMDDERRNKCDLCSNGRRKTFCSISKFFS